MSDEELEVFKEWEVELLREASFYDGDVEPDDGPPKEIRIFEDEIEHWMGTKCNRRQWSGRAHTA